MTAYRIGMTAAAMNITIALLVMGLHPVILLVIGMALVLWPSRRS